jgi:uncharacterized delta-60 repeat protein
MAVENMCSSRPKLVSEIARAADTVVEALEGRLVLSAVVDGAHQLPKAAIRTAGDPEDHFDLRQVFTDKDVYVRFNFGDSFGTTDVELRRDLFPAGTANNPIDNFLGYVNKDSYNGTIIHRAFLGGIVQGGEFDGSFSHVKPSPDLAAPFTVPNAKGTLALPVKTGSETDDNDSGWLFNLTDHPTAKNTVFGQVLGDDGLKPLTRIARVPTFPLAPPFSSLPIVHPNYALGDVIHPGDTVRVKDVGTLALYPDSSGVPSATTFQFTSSNTNIAVPSLTGTDLVIKYVGVGSATITVDAIQGGKVVATDKYVVTVKAADLGTPDPSTLGGSGVKDVSFGSVKTLTNDVATQSDGKIVVVGGTVAAAGDDTDIEISRTDATTGRADASFGDKGILVLGSIDTVTSTTDDVATAVEPSGKNIVFCGYVASTMKDATGRPLKSDVIVGRLTSTGALDATFGDSNGTGGRLGYAILNLTSVRAGAPATVDRANGLTVRPDGSIIVVGSSNAGSDGTDEMLVAKFTKDGKLDTTFGAKDKTGARPGYTLVTFGQAPGKPVEPSNDQANALTLQADGKIIMVGSARKSDGFSGFSVVRLTSIGEPDTTFGKDKNGRYAIDAQPSDTPGRVTTNEAFAVDLQLNNGKIVIGGTSASLADNGGDFKSDFALVRLNANGVLDDGTATDDESGVDPDPSDKFGTGGRSPTDTGGRAIYDFGGNEALKDLEIQSDGSIIATGTSTDASGAVRVIAAGYLSNGLLNVNFGGSADRPGSRVLFTQTASGGASLLPAAPTSELSASATAAAPVDLPSLYEQLVRARQGSLDVVAGKATVAAGRDQVVQLAVLKGDAGKPATFIQFNEVTSHAPSSTFYLFIVDDKSVTFSSIKSSSLQLFKGDDVYGESLQLVGVFTPNGDFQNATTNIENGLKPATSSAQVLVAKYRFVPPGGSWDSTENGDYDLRLASKTADQITDSDGNHVAAGRFDNQLNVRVKNSDSPVSAILQADPPLAQSRETSFNVTVVYDAAPNAQNLDDPGAHVDPKSIGPGNIRVVSEDGATELAVSSAHPDPANDGQNTPRLVVHYTIQKLDGSEFTASDNAVKYRVSVVDGQVHDLRTTPRYVQQPADLDPLIELEVPATAPQPQPLLPGTPFVPTATVIGTPDVNEASATFTVRYDDNSIPIDSSSLSGAEIQVVGPDGVTNYPVTRVGTPQPASDSGGGENAIDASYQFTPAAGAFHAADNGTYAIVLQNDAVFDAQHNAAAAGKLATFSVDVVDPVTTGPDFEVATISRLKTTKFLPGQSASVSVKVANLSTDDFPGADVTVTMMLRPSGGGDLVPLGGDPAELSFPAPSGKHAKSPKPAKLTFTVPASVAAGTYELVPALTASLPEKDFANNVKGFGTVEVVAPDVSVQTTPSAPLRAGKNGSFTLSVKNESSITMLAPATVTLAAVSAADGSVTQIGSQDLSRRRLAAGRSIVIKLRGSLPAGTYSLRATASTLDGEVRTDNNTVVSDPITIT